DGSDLSEQALPVALEIAACFDGEITLLHVVVPADVLLSRQRGYAAAFSELSALAEYLLDSAKSYLEELRASLEQQGRTVNAGVVEDEDIAEAILRTAQDIAADTIVMSTRSHGGIKRMVLGSIADRVVRQTTVTG